MQTNDVRLIVPMIAIPQNSYSVSSRFLHFSPHTRIHSDDPIRSPEEKEENVVARGGGGGDGDGGGGTRVRFCLSVPVRSP